MFVDQSWDNLKFPTTLMTFAEPSAKRVRLQVIDVFHGIEESGGSAAEGGSPARIGFFLGDEEEHLFLQIEDCPVTAIAREAPPQGVEGGETNHAGGSGRGPVLPPADYHWVTRSTSATRRRARRPMCTWISTILRPK